MEKEFLHSFVPGKTVTPFFISLAGITYPNPNYHIGVQNRNVTVIEYVTSGQGYILFDGDYHRVTADTVYILNKGEHHDYFADKNDPFTKIFLNVSGAMAKDLPSLYGLNAHVFVNRSLRAVFERIPQLLRSCVSEEQLQIDLQVILAEILTKLSFGLSKEENSAEAVRLKEYIETNTDRIVHVNELAKQIFRSVDYCQKLFLKEFQTTPYEYQINRKIMIAKNLLSNTDTPISAIGGLIGYHDPHYFSNIFKAKTGFSPSDYRKNKT